MGTTPVVTAAFPAVSLISDQVLAASTLFSAGDTSAEPILNYEIEDESTGPANGFWVLNGAVLPSGQITEISAAELSELIYVAGSDQTGRDQIRSKWRLLMLTALVLSPRFRRMWPLRILCPIR